MNSTFIYRILWWLLGLFSPNLQAELLEWGIQKRVFIDEVKTYENLRAFLFENELSTPIGVSADLDFEESTVDLLIQQGAGFASFGSYTLNATPEHQQKLYFKSGGRLRSLSHYMAKRNLLTAGKQLMQRRHLPHFIGIDLTSFNAEEIRINSAEVAPGYLSEYQLMVQKTAPYCDYLVVDMSAPLMPLHSLISDESSIMPLIQLVQETARIVAPIRTPKIVLKVPFDLTALEIKIISQIGLKTEIDAIIISGSASLHKNSKWIKSKVIKEYDSTTFMAGPSLKETQIRLIREFRKCTNGYIPIISSGVALTGKDVFDLLTNGAHLVEAGVAFYIKGPTAIQKMNAELSQILRKKGIHRIEDVIGINAPLDPDVEMRDLFN